MFSVFPLCHLRVRPRSPVYTKLQTVFTSQWNTHFFFFNSRDRGMFISFIHTEMNYWITWQYLCQIISGGFVLVMSIICSVDDLWLTGQVSRIMKALHLHRHWRTLLLCARNADSWSWVLLKQSQLYFYHILFPALKWVQMRIVFVSLIAACWGVYDRWGIVWLILVGKRLKKYKELSDASLTLSRTVQGGGGVSVISSVPDNDPSWINYFHIWFSCGFCMGRQELTCEI